ncbi:f-box domain protein [Colletotrichum sojae]|uniref:F-box domain protein n=1 Tax=Colletotrichum sojae TaxID=2175907 RepID=A0A8H6IV16_9PEZI|nr:f-box domain protein [Colletotrichum sojae]
MEVAEPELPRLPEEVIQLIVSHTPPATKRLARLANRAFCAAATPETFRHVQIGTYDYEAVKRVAERPHLSRHVRMVTCHHHGRSVVIDRGFLAALPSIRCFSALKVLILRFSRQRDFQHTRVFGNDMRYTLRHWIMFVLFSCILGDRVLEPNQSFGDREDDDFWLLGRMVSRLGITDERYWAFLRKESPRICLEQLSITNVAIAGTEEFGEDSRVPLDHPFKESQQLSWRNLTTFRRFMSLPSLRKLNLMISPDKEYILAEDNFTETASYGSRNNFPFVVNYLPAWLTPTLARNLTVLCLCHDEIWGYRPRFDFRCVNPGSGGDSGFPNLRVLSLVRYSFSHEWQIEWFASLGNHGLQELYLDECVLLSETHYHVVPSDVHVPDTRIQTDNGNEIVISNHGYLPYPWRDRHSWEHTTVFYRSNLKWRYFFDHWRTSMSSLRVFKMGSTTAHTIWSHAKMQDFWLGDPPRPSAVPAVYAFVHMKKEMQDKFQDPAFRQEIGMRELKLPFYVIFKPNPGDSAMRDYRPWAFLPAGYDRITDSTGAHTSGNEDIEALAMLRETVRQRAAGLLG